MTKKMYKTTVITKTYRRERVYNPTSTSREVVTKISSATVKMGVIVFIWNLCLVVVGITLSLLYLMQSCMPFPI